MWAELGWIAWLALGGLVLFLLFRRRGSVAGHGTHDMSGGHGEHEAHEEPALEGRTTRKHSRGGCC